jgi:hypothetical protein
MMFVSHKFENLVEGENEAWRRAGQSCLPEAWNVLSAAGLKYSVTDPDVRLFLKYALLFERFSAQALISSSFRPYCLKSTGVSIAALAKSLPSAHKFFEQTTLAAPYASNTQTSEFRERQVNSATQGFSAPTAKLNESLAVSTATQLFEEMIDHPPSSGIAQEETIEAPNRLNSGVGGGEDLSFVDPDIAIPDAPRILPKSHNSLHRSLSKLKKVIGLVQKQPKSTPNLPVNASRIPPLPALGLPHSSAKKRHLQVEEPIPREEALSGADEAWFTLPDPKNLQVPGLVTGGWRVMSEMNLLVNTISVFRLNPKVVTVGAYMVRRLCYSASPAVEDDVNSIRNRLPYTAIVNILLDALETLKKDVTAVAAILVALGNLALSPVSACSIGDHGLGLIFRVMKRHRSIPKIIEYSIFLLLNVCDKRIEYKKKLRDLDVPQFIVKELAKFVHSLRPNDKTHAKASSDAKGPSPKPSESLTASLKGVVASYDSVTHRHTPHSELSASPIASHEQSSLVDSQGAAAGGSERSAHSESSISVPDLIEEGEQHVEEVSEEMEGEENGTGSADDVIDERACAWMLKNRPSLAALHLDLILHRPADLRMINRLLDMLCVLSADYDILKTDLALKSANLIGDLIVMLFGSPWPAVDAVLKSAFRCLLVIYEWDVHHQDWASCARLVHSLLFLARAFVKARIRLPYATNCYLVIFSLVWKRWDQHAERKELVNLIISSLHLEQLLAGSRGSHSARTRASHGTSSTSQKPNSTVSPLLIPGAAMLGDLAHSFYNLRTHIRDVGGIQLLRVFKEGLEGDTLARLNDILDEFEDNPLLRGLHRRNADPEPDNAPALDDAPPPIAP